MENGFRPTFDDSILDGRSPPVCRAVNSEQFDCHSLPPPAMHASCLRQPERGGGGGRPVPRAHSTSRMFGMGGTSLPAPAL